MPSVGDNGATLACVATNPAMAPNRGSKADVITLNVTCKFYMYTVDVAFVLWLKVRICKVLFFEKCYNNNLIVYPTLLI